jgi:predicted O-linked N-acetylglucosamine transferase (SPINDLY family)
MQRTDINLPQDRPVYACVQSLYKIHPDFDDLIAGILRQDPQGLVVLFEDKHAQRGNLLRRRFARKMPGVCHRVRFLKRLPHDKFMAFLNIADVLLDTHHFSGGYTSLLALAKGTPIVTWPGEFMRGRLTYSFFKSIQTLDTVAHNRETYVQMACKLAHDRLWREEIRNKIRTRSGCLYDNPETVKELEDFFPWAWQNAARLENR